MAEFNRPRGREKNVTGEGKDVFRRGSGTGSGPVGKGSKIPGSSGNSGGFGNAGGDHGNMGGGPGRPGGPGGFDGNRGAGFGGGRSSRGSGGKRSGGGLPLIIVAAVVLLGGGGIGANSLFGGSDSGYYSSSDYYNSSDYYGNQGYEYYSEPTAKPTAKPTSKPTAKPTAKPTEKPANSGSVSGSWDQEVSTEADSSTAKGARDKYTVLKGKGKDTVTVMVYMCGTDLESKSGMATSDLSEMTKATIGSNVNVIVYTGGCTRWQNDIVSKDVNQIYQVKSGGLKVIEKNMGSKPMTDPGTLKEFIRYCTENFPANRNELIFWDHGGGSLSGFGYDQKYTRSGSMTLSGIDTALAGAGAKFDFIGFDACLMGTCENALMLADYADYLIASEETEPGTGWYYTNWLTSLSDNTSISTVELGRQIIDDFTDVTARVARGQSTTLSLVDLAEMSYTVPKPLNKFAVATYNMINDGDYAKVSNARSGAKEFSRTSKLDQVDLAHLAYKLDTKESRTLAKAIVGAVKYNRTSSDITNAYGLSIYFPYRNTSGVSSAVATYKDIGIDDEYSRCIEAFASLEYAGQSSSGGSGYSSYNSLMDYYGYGSYGSSSQYGSQSYDSYSDIFSLIESVMGGYGRSLDSKAAAKYIENNRFDATALVWKSGKSGYEISMSEKNWSMVHDLELNVFYDDGEGFIDLGLDNVFDFTDKGALVGSFDGTWLAINEQPVAYYHTETVEDGDNYTITGRVPVLYNGDRADLMLVFDNDNPYGYVSGVRYDYRDGQTETVAKGITEIFDGDTIDFLCDYYTYDGEYTDSYKLGERMTVKGELEISNVYLPDRASALASYKFTDMYNQSYWTPVIPE